MQAVPEEQLASGLEEYANKRDFRKTGEPGADAGPVRFEWAGDGPVFVVQEHDASTRHFDLRLEVDGVLKSWAVPKGPSTDPADRRLAVPTEDHPLAYADFEGCIPEGEYGAGTVIVWDRGRYDNLGTRDDGKPVPLQQQIDDGLVTVRLHGEKISGGYALLRTAAGKDARWLLVKMDDDDADARRNPVSTEPASVKSGRTVAEARRAGE